MSEHPLRPVGLSSQPVDFKILPPLSLYIHIPWCVRKCPYCDFNSHEVRAALPENEYINALIRDLELSLPDIWGRKIYTVFFGGGTPSLLSGEGVERILRSVRTLLPLDMNAEITLEANPGTVEAVKFAAYRDAGVNRLSLGIQSFNDDHLRALGRIHTADEARQAIDIAQRHFDNFNLDLMYGLPPSPQPSPTRGEGVRPLSPCGRGLGRGGKIPPQSLNEALQDIHTALNFAPPHLSCYHLTLEPNTLFHRYPPALPDDDASSEMQQQIETLLTAQGYEHYEVSAFARTKHRSRHNLNYWQFGDYLGIGTGAHSKLSFPNRVIRRARYKQPEEYMRRVNENAPVQDERELNRDDLVFEFMMNALRLNEGFDAALFQERTSLPLLVMRHELDEAERRGLLARKGQRIMPTTTGRRFLNDLLQLFLRDE